MDSSSPLVSPTPARRSLTAGSNRTTQLNDTQLRILPTPPTIHSYLSPNRQVGQQYHPSDVGMDPETSPRTQEDKPGMYDDDDDDESTPGAELEDRQFDRESSSESFCLRRERPLLQVESARVKAPVPGKPRPLSGNARSTDRNEINREQSAPQCGTGQSSSTAKTSVTRQRKKPGPRPWATKPPKKNDMAVKIQVISEIEGYWGKNFITAYIPKCHRPLVKSTKGKKCRSHESNPKNWLPSILKAILTLAKLTQNKVWLKKAINDIVRYRIKHTGNRKPQLTTTDFDVLEDMLVSGWKISYTFPIRYKYLLVKGENEEVNDEDIDNILGVCNRSELGSGDKGRSDDDYSTGSEDDETDEEAGGADEDEQQTREYGLSDKHFQHSGYTNASQDAPPASVQQRVDKTKPSKQLLSQPKQSNLPSLSDQQALYGYSQPRGYEASNNPWGHPMHGFGHGPVDSRPHDAHNGYGPYGSPANYNSYGGYGPPRKDGRGLPQQWGQHVMNQWSAYHPFSRLPSFTGSENGRHADYRSTQFSPYNNTPNSREGYPNAGSDSIFQSLEPHSYTENFTGPRSGAQCDSTDHDDHAMAMDDARGSANDSVDNETAAIEAELRATELELKVAQLKSKRAAMKLQSKGK